MDTTGRALVDHWSWAAAKGLMNKNTAHGLRSACTQVLSVDDGWESADLRKLDVEELLIRFQNLKGRNFQPVVLETYKRRFRQGLVSFLAYVENPGAWKYAEPRQLKKDNSARRTERQSARDEAEGPSPPTNVKGEELRGTGLFEYPFPLRVGVTARLVLPRDLKTQDVKRLTAFMSTLTVDFEGS